MKKLVRITAIKAFFDSVLSTFSTCAFVENPGFTLSQKVEKSTLYSILVFG